MQYCQELKFKSCFDYIDRWHEQDDICINEYLLKRHISLQICHFILNIGTVIEFFRFSFDNDCCLNFKVLYSIIMQKLFP